MQVWLTRPNNAGASKTKMIVILNDNDMSIARPVGLILI